MYYPESILPKPNYKDKIELENVNTNKKIIMRCSLKTSEESFINNEIPREEALVSRCEEFLDWSTSLLGFFKPEYFRINICSDKIKELRYKTWSKEVPIPNCDDIECDELIEKPIFFIPVIRFHNIKQPAEVWENQKTKTIQIICKIIHSPTPLNYWHFVINFFRDNKQLKNMSRWIKNFLSNFISTLIKELIVFEPEYEMIEEEHYLSQEYYSSY